jgi:hypothetical protein
MDTAVIVGGQDAPAVAHPWLLGVLLSDKNRKLATA